MLLWLIYPILEAIIQGLMFRYIKGFDPHKEPMYLRLIRGTVFFTWAIWFQYQYNLKEHLMEDWNSLWFIIIMVTFSMTSFWIIFDLVLNLMRGKRWDHSGTESGYLDNLDEVSQTFYLMWKVVALVAAIVTCYLGISIYQ